MRITFESDSLIPPVSKAISILLDKASVCVDDIHYDVDGKTVTIYMQRREITGFKTSFWGEIQPLYGQTMIQSLLTIRQVEEMKIEVDDRLVDNCDSCFTVLFGLKVENNQLYLGSAEEAQGKKLCQIRIKVNGTSIEYYDELIESEREGRTR